MWFLQSYPTFTIIRVIMAAIEIVSNIRDYEIYWISLIVSKVNKYKNIPIISLVKCFHFGACVLVNNHASVFIPQRQLNKLIIGLKVNVLTTSTDISSHPMLIKYMKLCKHISDY